MKLIKIENSNQSSANSLLEHEGFVRKDMSEKEYSELEKLIRKAGFWVGHSIYTKNNNLYIFQNWYGDGRSDSSNPKSMPLKIKGIEVLEIINY